MRKTVGKRFVNAIVQIIVFVVLIGGTNVLAVPSSGSSGFGSPGGPLTGHVDYTVYTPGSYSGIDDYVYSYQVFNDAGSKVGIDYFSVGLRPDSPALYAWAQPPGDKIPMSFVLETSVLYVFAFPVGNIKPNERSVTLLFASDCPPGADLGTGVVAGGVAGGLNVSVPIPRLVPEPAAMSLLGLGALFGLRRRKRV